MELVKVDDNNQELKRRKPKPKRRKFRGSKIRRLAGRKIIFREIHIPEVGKAEYKDIEAFFVEWGLSMSDVDGGPIQISTAICIDCKGLVRNIPAQFVRFI